VLCRQDRRRARQVAHSFGRGPQMCGENRERRFGRHPSRTSGTQRTAPQTEERPEKCLPTRLNTKRHTRTTAPSDESCRLAQSCEPAEGTDVRRGKSRRRPASRPRDLPPPPPRNCAPPLRRKSARTGAAARTRRRPPEQQPERCAGPPRPPTEQPETRRPLARPAQGAKASPKGRGRCSRKMRAGNVA
jgi:hypothetical protein